MARDMRHLMEEEPAATAIIRLALPMMLAMIAQMVYNMTDTFFIGQTGDPNMVAGISLVMPLFLVSQGVGNIFGIGAASYISRKLGEKDGEAARRINAVSFYTTAGFGVIITAALLLFKTPILRLIGTSDITFSYADDYFTIIGAFIVFAIANISLSGQARSEGATDKSMKGMMLGITANIILDPVFILVLGWGVKGAAWATIAGQAASVAYFIHHFTSKHTVLSIKLADFKPQAVIYKEVLKIGIPAALSHVIMTFAAILTNIIAASYGDFVVAGNGVMMRVASMSFMLVMALAQGFQPFAGYNYGANNFTRLKSGIKITLLYTTGLSCFFFALFLAAGPSLIALFIRDEATVSAGTSLIRAFVWGLPLMGAQMTFMVTFQALGKPLFATIVTLGRQFLFYLPLLFIMNQLWQFDGYIYAQPVADALTGFVALFLYLAILKDLKARENAIPAPLETPFAKLAGEGAY